MQLESQLLIGFLFGTFIGFFSYKIKLLSLSGMITEIAVATIIYGFGGLQYTVPIVTFFIFSSFLSKVRQYYRREMELIFEKISTRDYVQVLANGGLPCLILIVDYFVHLDFGYYLYIASLCVSASDTWATEIGTIKKTRTYNIRNFKIVNQGTSGGVSLIGTVGASLGSLSITLSALPWVENYHLLFVVSTFLIGVIGSFYDSLLGSTLQAQYICEACKKVTERKIHCSIDTTIIRGRKFFNNDAVNLISILLGVLTMSVLLIIIY